MPGIDSKTMMKLGLTAVLVSGALQTLSAQELVGWHAVWKYSVNMGDQGTAWKEPNFDDSSWLSGPGPLGYGADESLVPIVPPQPFPPGTTLGNSGGTVFAANPNSAANRTTYYRTRFAFNGDPSTTPLRLEGLLDDAAVVYLNGRQIANFGAVPMPFDFTTLVDDRLDVSDRSLDIMTFVGSDDLLAGENVLAFEIHQSSNSSSDLVAGLRLIGDSDAPQVVQAQWLNETNVRVQFDEPLDVSGASMQASTYAILPQGGGTLEVGSVEFANNDTALILTLPPGLMRDPAQNYSVRLGDSVSASFVSDLLGNQIIPPLTVPLASALVVMDWTSVWRFDQNGTDLGMAWIDAGYDDSSWRSGPGILGQEPDLNPPINSGLPPIMTDLMSGTEGGPDTIYFRKKFTLPVPLSDVVELNLEFIYDDGFVLHLNGTEALRRGVPANQMFGSLATSHEADEVETTVLTGVVEGENSFAVEVHQATSGTNSPSSDIVWGCRLVALVTQLPSGPPSITQAPFDLTVAEGGSATFSVEASGARPLTYQWQHAMVDLLDQTNQLLTLNNVQPPDAGNYRVLVMNSQGTNNSPVATLTVNADETRPTLVSALGASDLTHITLTFSEGMDLTRAELATHYDVRVRGGGASLGVTSAMLINETNVLLTTPARSTTVNYEVVVTDLADDAFAKNLVNPNPTTANLITWVNLVPIDDVQLWRYNQTDVFPGATWASPSFNDSEWQEGPALFAVETTPLAFPLRTELTLLVTNGSVVTNITTYYFRTHFNFSGEPASAEVMLTPVIDDAAVVYLNGTEIFRVGITNDPVMHSDLASPPRNVGNAAPEGPFNLGVLPQLLAGDNVVAVEVHQANLSSSDVVMGLQMDALVETLGPDAPRLSSRRLSNGEVQLSWTAGPEYILVQSATVKGPYTAVAGNPASGVTITPAAGAQMFFQLVK